MLTNLACPISRLRVGMGFELHYGTEITPQADQTRRHGSCTEGWKDASEDNKKCMIVQCATFSKSLNHRNIAKSVSDIRIRIRFLFEGSFWIYVSGCNLTILPDIQPANRVVIISAASNISEKNAGTLVEKWKVIFKTWCSITRKRQELVTEMHHKSYSAPEPQRQSGWKKLPLFFSFTNLCFCFM